MSAEPKVLLIHTPYEHFGGEDAHLELLKKAYQALSINVTCLPKNRDFSSKYTHYSLQSLFPTSTVPRWIEEVYENEKPDFIHAHNLFPVFGPRFLRWIIKNKIPLLMTVHNHRFFCTNGLALRDQKTCKDCFNSKITFKPLFYNCNQSWSKTLYHSLALSEIRFGNLYKRAVKKFIAPSPYIQNELLKYGISKQNISQITNPIEPSSQHKLQNQEQSKKSIFYAGRLSYEKGISNLLSTIKLLPDLQFYIAGAGPLKSAVESTASQIPNLKYLGSIPSTEVQRILHQVDLAILPSICNEILPTFVLEAFCSGVRCIVPDIESTLWLTEEPFIGIKTDTTHPNSIANNIQLALNLPKVSLKQKEELINFFSFKKFCTELKGVIENV